MYIAAPWTHRFEARNAATQVISAGYTITWDWWNHECGDEDSKRLAELARKDYGGVCSADKLLLLNYEKSEGKAVEQGIALAEGIPIVGVGKHPTNIFQNLPTYTWVDTVEEAIDVLGR